MYPTEREKEQQSLLLSDVSEEMYNRVIWWLKGLCFSLLWVHSWGLGGRRTVGRVASVSTELDLLGWHMLGF